MIYELLTVQLIVRTRAFVSKTNTATAIWNPSNPSPFRRWVRPDPIGFTRFLIRPLGYGPIDGSAGFCVETSDPLELLDGPIQFDVFGQFHRYIPRVLTRLSDPDTGYPIDSTTLPIGGYGWIVGGQWRFE